MTANPLDTKVIHFYRDALTFFTKQRQACHDTTPFLEGVGCGGGAFSDYTIEQARKAIDLGYKIEVQRTMDNQNKRYPLHPEDLILLQGSFSAENFL